MPARNKNETNQALKGGVIAGIVGGLVLAVFMLAMNIMSGRDIWIGMKMAGAPFLGERAMQPGFDAPAVLVGVLSHVAVSIVWGALFGILFYGLSRAATMFAGVAWGIVAWIGMFYVLLPLLGLGAVAAGMPVGIAIFEHVLFGVAVAAAFLPFQRRIPRAVFRTRPTA